MDEWEGVKATLGVFVGNEAGLWELLNEAASNPELALELVQNVGLTRDESALEARCNAVSTITLHRRNRSWTTRGDSWPFTTPIPSSLVSTSGVEDDVASRPVTAFFNDLRKSVCTDGYPRSAIA